MNMNKKTLILFFLGDLVVIFLVAAFFFAPLGHSIGLGRTWTDECCIECGSFRKGTYATIFNRSFPLGFEPHGENSIQMLHDSFFAPCKEHKWWVYHLTRGSIDFKGSSESHLPANYEVMKNFSGSQMKTFISDHPDLASQTAGLFFEYSRRGKNSQTYQNLQLAIDAIVDMSDDSEIKTVLASMTAEVRP